ncbi:hypothetical protein HMPREF2767_00455 [Nosocomiicoccus sp. HMSC067E10]|uniref:BrxA/BrxB family bacilliredoxin n=1 Tax=Nosocomiicoccus sp. HMSC067E10 TaxID=1739271 RepID=UPI0008A1AF72|nr:BrxA/BrxB family bacilliredoxin [Nosocomiicoccus sp. HMSC067E10]OFL47037.1 hypothetical protein HMPREF2767_00455 [Nosocomiicoccus sp. HMSC067E10]
MDLDFKIYMEDLVENARKELTDVGYEQLLTPKEVNEALDKEGTALVMINSVCGCAGGIARPAAIHSLNFDKKPTHLYTVFAGQEKDATEAVRERTPDFLPSSPSFAFFKDGKVVDMIERHEIEGHDVMSVITDLQAWFMEHGDDI